MKKELNSLSSVFIEIFYLIGSTHLNYISTNIKYINKLSFKINGVYLLFYFIMLY